MTLQHTTVIQPGQFTNGEYQGPRILDYSGWRPTISQLDDIGAVAVMRYVAQRTIGPTGRTVTWAEIQASNLHTKCITMQEADYYLSNGIGLLTNHELYATRFAGGDISGTVDGQFYAGVADEFGMPDDLPLYFSDDTNVTVDTLPVHLAYARAAKEQVNLAGFYGDNDILSACYVAGLSRDLWYAGARAWSNYLPPIEPCTMQQTSKGSTTNYDMNYVLKPVTVWLPHEVQPPTKEPTMIIVQNSETCPPSAHKLEQFPNDTFPPRAILWELTNGALRWISPNEYPALVNGPNPVLVTGYYNNTELAILPRYTDPSTVDCRFQPLQLPLTLVAQTSGVIDQ